MQQAWQPALAPRTDMLACFAATPPHPEQVWQWVRYGASLDGGKVCSADLVRQVIEEELEAVRAQLGSEK